MSNSEYQQNIEEIRQKMNRLQVEVSDLKAGDRSRDAIILKIIDMLKGMLDEPLPMPATEPVSTQPVIAPANDKPKVLASDSFRDPRRSPGPDDVLQLPGELKREILSVECDPNNRQEKWIVHYIDQDGRQGQCTLKTHREWARKAEVIT